MSTLKYGRKILEEDGVNGLKGVQRRLYEGLVDVLSEEDVFENGLMGDVEGRDD